MVSLECGVVFSESQEVFFVLSCSFVMFVCCFGDGAKEAHAESPADAEVAAESVIPADEIFFGRLSETQCIAF